MNYRKLNKKFKIIFIISIFLLLFNTNVGKSDHVLTTRNSVTDVAYRLYKDCSSIMSQDSNLRWYERASNCVFDQGRGFSDSTDKNPLNFVYLGIGTTVPSNIETQYDQVTAGWLEYWKTQLVGLSEGQFKSFILPSSEHSYPQFADKDLFYEIQIVKIFNLELAIHADLSTTTTSNPTPVVGDDNSLIIGVVLLAFIGSSGVFAYLKLQNPPSVRTEEIISTNKARESERIQSLKDVISERETSKGNVSKPKSNKPKGPKTRRRR